LIDKAETSSSHLKRKEKSRLHQAQPCKDGERINQWETSLLYIPRVHRH